MILKNLWNILFEVKPFREGWLPVADGHEVWFAEYGNPHGKPVLTTHGGPGGHCHSSRLKLFDLKSYRVVMFDQRGCGRSKPFGRLEHNTTDGLLFDMERLLDHLHIKEKIILQGGSWASTLALAFAERYPDRVEKLLLSQIFLADEMNEKWVQEQCGLFYPDMLEDLRKPLKHWQNPSEYYYKLLTSENVAQQKKALETYGSFEHVLGALSPRFGKISEVKEKMLAYTRIYAQYAVNHYYLKSNELMHNVRKIKHIPTLIVHNRLDMVCPLKGAYDLSQKIEKCRFVVVPAKGHGGKLLRQTLKNEIRRFLKTDNFL